MILCLLGPEAGYLGHIVQGHGRSLGCGAGRPHRVQALVDHWGQGWTFHVALASGNSVILQIFAKSLSSFSTVLFLFPTLINISGIRDV